MNNNLVLYDTYAPIDKRVLGRALADFFGGTWRVGHTLGVRVHVQRLDRGIDGTEVAIVRAMVSANKTEVELRESIDDNPITG